MLQMFEHFVANYTLVVIVAILCVTWITLRFLDTLAKVFGKVHPDDE